MSAIDQWLERKPVAGETCVFSDPGKWRRDALMFDRVYAPLVGNRGVSYLDHAIDTKLLSPPDIPPEFSFGIETVEHEHNRGLQAMAPAVAHGALSQEDVLIHAQANLESSYAAAGCMGIWCTSDHGLYIKRFSEGQVNAYEGALNNIPIVDDAVGWDEVRAFREDRESVRKYRDLRLWLDVGLSAHSVQQATDMIGQKIEDYRFAIQKHGFRTAIGALSNLQDWKRLAAVAGGLSVGAVIGGSLAEWLAGGLAISSTVGAWCLERKISAEEVRRGEGREVAILVDMQNRFAPDRA